MEMNRRFGHSAMFRNLLRFTWIVLQAAFHFLKGSMSCYACDSCHAFPLLS